MFKKVNAKNLNKYFLPNKQTLDMTNNNVSNPPRAYEDPKKCIISPETVSDGTHETVAIKTRYVDTFLPPRASNYNQRIL